MPTDYKSELAGFTLVCGNNSKIAEAERITGFRFKRASLAIEEVQASNCVLVAQSKARAAARELGKDVIVEDVGLSVSALCGFPGPFVKFWCERRGGDASICRAVSFSADRSAIVTCALVAARFAGELITAIGELHGDIASEPRGSLGFGFDSIFCPRGFDGLTLAELTLEQRDSVSHRAKAWEALRRALSEQRCCP